MIRAEVDQAAIKLLISRVKEVDPSMMKAFTKDFKSDLEPYAASVANAVPAFAPLKGFLHQGRTSWSKPTGKVVARLSAGAGRAAFMIRVEGTKGKLAGLKIGDLAGYKNKIPSKPMVAGYTRSDGIEVPAYKNTGNQGRALVRALEASSPLYNGRGGRYVFRAYIMKKPQIIAAADAAFTKFAQEASRKLAA